MSESKPEILHALSAMNAVEGPGHGVVEQLAKRRKVTEELLGDFIEIIEGCRANEYKIGVGNSADIYNKVTIPGHSDPFCMKEINRQDARLLKGIDVFAEFRNQAVAFSLLESARVQGEKVASVPEPYFALKDEERQVFFMDLVDGKTMLRLAMERLAEIHGIAFDQENLLDHEYFHQLGQLLIPGYNPNDEVSRSTLMKIIYKENNKNPILTREQGEVIKNTVDVLNRSGFYHRDLHPRNFMVGREGQIFLIDFGTSKYQPGLRERDAYSIEGEANVAWQSDRSFLTELENFVPKEANREASKKRMAKAEALIDSEIFSDFKKIKTLVSFVELLQKPVKENKLTRYIINHITGQNAEFLVNIKLALEKIEVNLGGDGSKTVNFVESLVLKYARGQEIFLRNFKKEMEESQKIN